MISGLLPTSSQASLGSWRLGQPASKLNIVVLTVLLLKEKQLLMKGSEDSFGYNSLSYYWNNVFIVVPGHLVGLIFSMFPDIQ